MTATLAFFSFPKIAYFQVGEELFDIVGKRFAVWQLKMGNIELLRHLFLPSNICEHSFLQYIQAIFFE